MCGSFRFFLSNRVVLKPNHRWRNATTVNLTASWVCFVITRFYNRVLFAYNVFTKYSTHPMMETVRLWCDEGAPLLAQFSTAGTWCAAFAGRILELVRLLGFWRWGPPVPFALGGLLPAMNWEIYTKRTENWQCLNVIADHVSAPLEGVLLSNTCRYSCQIMTGVILKLETAYNSLNFNLLLLC